MTATATVHSSQVAPTGAARMHVMHVINRLSGSGAETSLRGILIGTAGGDLRHTLVVFTPKGNRLDGLADAGIDIIMPVCPVTGWRARIDHVRQALARCEPDLVHTTLFEADVAGRVAARVAGVPCLTSIVNTSYTPEAMRVSGAPPWKTRTVRAVDRVLSRHATSAFHAITQAAATAAVRDLHIEPERIHVVPRGRDPASLGRSSARRRADVRHRLGIDTDRPVVVNVARQEPQKGIVHLIDAMAILVEDRPDVLLLQVGRSGNQTAQLERRIRATGLDDHVRFLGRRSDVGDLLAASDVFAFPSLYEGLGGAVLEAMAVGVPIVASDIPALREVLDDGRCGRLVPPGAAPSLAHTIVDLLDDTAGAARLASHARDRFERSYDLSTCLADMRELYLRLGSTPARAISGQDPAC